MEGVFYVFSLAFRLRVGTLLSRVEVLFSRVEALFSRVKALFSRVEALFSRVGVGNKNLLH